MAVLTIPRTAKEVVRFLGGSLKVRKRFRFHEVSCTTRATDYAESFSVGRRVSLGKTFADNFRILSGIVEIERIPFALLPKQNIGRKEIRRLISRAIRKETWPPGVTADRAVHRVTRELLGPPKIQEALASHGVSPVGRADQYPLAFKEPRELPREIEGNLFSVRVRATLARGDGSRLACWEPRRVTPVVGSGEVRPPTRMRQRVVGVRGIHRYCRHDSLHVVKANRALGTVGLPRQDREYQQ